MGGLAVPLRTNHLGSHRGQRAALLNGREGVGDERICLTHMGVIGQRHTVCGIDAAMGWLRNPGSLFHQLKQAGRFRIGEPRLGHGDRRAVLRTTCRCIAGCLQQLF